MRRDYSDGGAGVILIVVALAVLIAWAVSGCASRPALLMESQFELRVMPPIVMQGGALRISCFVPESLGRGVIRLALEGVRVTGPVVLEHAQNSLEIPRVECGSWKATCRVATEGGERFAERDVLVRGGMCEGGPVAVPAR